VTVVLFYFNSDVSDGALNACYDYRIRNGPQYTLLGRKENDSDSHRSRASTGNM
jgi:hypothetical protein